MNSCKMGGIKISNLDEEKRGYGQRKREGKKYIVISEEIASLQGDPAPTLVPPPSWVRPLRGYIHPGKR